MAIPTDDQDLNQQYQAELKLIEVKAAKEKRVISPDEKQEDYYKGFRSAVVLFWIGCNVALVAVILSTGGQSTLTLGAAASQSSKAQTYLLVVLWSVAGLSAFRFIGAMWFLIVRMFRGV